MLAVCTEGHVEALVAGSPKNEVDAEKQII
jgi:hypothetical protein